MVQLMGHRPWAACARRSTTRCPSRRAGARRLDARVREALRLRQVLRRGLHRRCGGRVHVRNARADRQAGPCQQQRDREAREKLGQAIPFGRTCMA